MKTEIYKVFSSNITLLHHYQETTLKQVHHDLEAFHGLSWSEVGLVCVVIEVLFDSH